jgi:DNA-binding NtrC family response regulator
LNVFNIHLPPLRERQKDIPILARHLLKKIASQNKTKQKKISPAAMEKLIHYNWPGNIRELENILERATVYSTEETLLDEHIILGRLDKSYTIQAGMKINEISQRLLEQTLKACAGNKTKAAEMMGVSLRWIHYQLKNNPGL